MKTTLSISKQDLCKATELAILSAQQADLLWDHLKTKRHPFISVCYYFGSCLILLAMTWFMTNVWECYFGIGTLLVSLLYGTLLYLSGFFLWKKRSLQIPGGLLVTLSACMTPLIIYSLQKVVGFDSFKLLNYGSYYHIVGSHWIWMETATTLCAATFLYFIRFPFLVMPIAVSLWFMSMDISLLFLKEQNSLLKNESFISALFGFIMLLASYSIDRKNKQAFAFWGYLFGGCSFFGSLFFLLYACNFSSFLYLTIHLAAIATSIFIQRKILLVFGSLGVFSYLSYLAYDIFTSQVLFAIILCCIGVLILGSTLWYQVNRSKV